MNEKMTIRDALFTTINLLGNISVPRVLNQTIGIPIDNAINNLRVCIEAMDNKEEDSNGDSNAE